VMVIVSISEKILLPIICFLMQVLGVLVWFLIAGEQTQPAPKSNIRQLPKEFFPPSSENKGDLF